MNSHARLAVIAANLRAGTIDSESRKDLATTLERIASGEEATAVLHLKPRPGQRLWTTVAALAERDRWLRLAAARLAPDAPKAEQARALHAALLRYSSTAWQRERVLEECPPRHAGSLYALL